MPEQVELYVTLEGADKKLDSIVEYMSNTVINTITWYAEDSEVSKNLATCLARKYPKDQGVSLLPPRVAMHIPMPTIIVIDRLRKDNLPELKTYMDMWKSIPSLTGFVAIQPKVIALVCSKDVCNYVDVACYEENHAVRVLTQFGIGL